MTLPWVKASTNSCHSNDLVGDFQVLKEIREYIYLIFFFFSSWGMRDIFYFFKLQHSGSLVATCKTLFLPNVRSWLCFWASSLPTPLKPFPYYRHLRIVALPLQNKKACHNIKWFFTKCFGPHIALPLPEVPVLYPPTYTPNLTLIKTLRLWLLSPFLFF